MTAPNHAAGGVFFSALMCSFWNINLFASPFWLGLSVFCSLLPDADTGKTLIGRLLYPFARLIEKNYGHRTLTHSLPFLAFVLAILLMIRQFIAIDKAIIMIVFFSMFSHCLLDMLTVQGVPLFWPFLKNPCVLPANPNYRISSGNVRIETIVFICIILLSVTLAPLFNYGFWTSYNRFFGTIEHVEREDRNSSTYTIADYAFIKNGDTISGSGYVVESHTHEMTIYDNKKLVSICQDSIQVIYAKPRHSNVLKVTTQVNFFNISSDSLHRILKNRIVSGTIQSNQNVKFTDEKNLTYHTNFIKLKHSFNFAVAIAEDSLHNNLRDRRAKILAQLRRDSLEVVRYNNEYNKLTAKRLNLIYQLSAAVDNYQKNKLQNEVIALDSDIKNFKIHEYIPNIVLLTELATLNKELQIDKGLLFSGFLTFPEFNKMLKKS